MKPLFALAVVVVTLSLSCASDAPARKKKKKLGPPPTAGAVETLPSNDAHFAEVRKSAAEQLECPEDQLLMQCTAWDRDRQCIAVRATGCDKSFEYQFGTE